MACICLDVFVDPKCADCNDLIDLAKEMDAQMHRDKESVERRARELELEMAKKKERQDRIYEKVQSVFPEHASVYVVHRNGGFTIELQHHETSFADLQALSEAFGTKRINLGSETRNDGFCDTCSYSYTVNLVRVDDISEEWR